MVAMRMKYFAHLALAGLLVWGAGAAGAENQNQNQKGKPAQVRSGGSAKINTGGGVKFHAQSQGADRINRGNVMRVQNQNRVTVRERSLDRNTTIRRDVTRNRAVINQPNLRQKSVQRIERSRIRTGEGNQAGKRVAMQISQTQRVRIHEAFRQHRGHFHRVAHVGFPIFVGAEVPSDYSFYDVSTDFADYAPEYEGYKYIVVGNELLIIDPETWEIVAIIPV
jgi:Protein of unknown function (DUF1236)